MKSNLLFCWVMLAGLAVHAQNQITLTLTTITVDANSCIIDQESGNEEPSIAAWVDDTESSLVFKFGYSLAINAAGTYTLPNASGSCSNSQGIYTFITSASSLTLWIEIYEDDNAICTPPIDGNDDCPSQGYQTIDLTQSTGTWTGGEGLHFNFTITSQLLPVELVSFEARENEGEVLLSWETATEQDNHGFYVERSIDGSLWFEMGFVEGAGFSTKMLRYTFSDLQPLAGMGYYRLRQTDFNGNSDYSPVRSVRLEKADGFPEIFPNPASEVLNVRLADTDKEPVQVQLFSALGQKVGQFNLEHGEGQFQLEGLPIGLYFLAVEGKEGLVKWVKN